jgi:hypothetical protein
MLHRTTLYAYKLCEYITLKSQWSIQNYNVNKVNKLKTILSQGTIKLPLVLLVKGVLNVNLLAQVNFLYLIN